MIHRAINHFVRIVGTIGLCLLITASFVAWRLSKGPVAMDFLTSYIEEALSPVESGYSVKINKTILTWGKGIRPLDIKAVGLEILGKEKVVVATVPEISISLSGKALLKGHVAPRTIEVVKPRVRLSRKADGSINLGINFTEEKSGKEKNIIPVSLMKPLTGIFKPLGTKGQVKYLKHIEVSNAQVVIEDFAKDRVWHLPDTNIEVKRGVYFIMANARMNLNLSGKTSKFNFLARYGFSDNELISKIGFEKTDFANMKKEFPFMSFIEMPLSGAIESKIDLTEIIKTKNYSTEKICNSIKTMNFDVFGDRGILKIPEPINSSYDLTSFALKGRSGKALNELEIEELIVKQKDSSAILTGKGKNIRNIITGNKPEKTDIVLNADIPVLSIDKLPDYWPESIGNDTRKWIKENLSDGVIDNANFTFKIKGSKTENKFEVKKIDGLARLRDVTVRYMKEMPVVRKAAGVAYFSMNKIRIDVSKGHTFGLNVSEGRLVFDNLWKGIENTDIKLTFNGPVSDALKLIDYEPLGYAKKLNLVPKEVLGTAVTKLGLNFPITKNLGLDKIKVTVDSSLHDVSIPGIFHNSRLNKGELALTLDNEGMDIKGDAEVKEIPATFHWRENFSKSEFESRYKIKTLIDVTDLKKFDFDMDFLKAPYLKGKIATDVVLTLKDHKKGFLGIQANLDNAEVFIPVFGWKKKKDVPAMATISARVFDDKMYGISKFRISSGDNLVLQGSAKTSDRIEFDEFILDKNDMKVSIDSTDKEKITVNISGKSFDLHQVLDEKKRTDKEDKETKKTIDKAIDINVAVDRMWTSKKGYLEQVGLAAERANDRWQSGRVIGQVADKKTFRLDFVPDNEEYTFKVTSENAGEALKAFGLFENIKEGELLIEGRQDKDDNIEGNVEIKDYRLVGAPVFARLLTIASLTGIVDLLSGEGIGFWNMELPFSYDGSVFSVKEATTAGTSIGVTCSGEINTDTDEADFEGALVPVYVVNGLIGKIPLIGRLLVGKKGEGVFAANYRIKGDIDNPEITVNPLSALAPGFLRRFFSNIGKTDKPKDVEKIESKKSEKEEPEAVEKSTLEEIKKNIPEKIELKESKVIKKIKPKIKQPKVPGRKPPISNIPKLSSDGVMSIR